MSSNNPNYSWPDDDFSHDRPERGQYVPGHAECGHAFQEIGILKSASLLPSTDTQNYSGYSPSRHPTTTAGSGIYSTISSSHQTYPLSMFDDDDSRSDNISYVTGDFPPARTQWIETQAPSGPHLWCEFADVLGCRQTFNLSSKDRWIDHHLEHYANQPPPRVICWFCDGKRFKTSGYPFDSTSNFCLRMEHIYRHIWKERKVITDTRPDFLAIRPLVVQGQLSEQEWAAISGYTELEDQYRHPDASGWSIQPSLAPAVAARGELHDLAREARHQRRQGRHR